MTETRATDVVVLGIGPGGEEVVSRLAQAGLDVTAVDAELTGGECPYWGCIPSKMMIRASNLLAEGRRIDGMAGTATITSSWDPVARRVREATDDWDDTVAVERLEKNGAHFVRGWGKLDGPGRVVVGDLELVASRGVVVNTGCRPFIPPIPGLADLDFWTNRQAIEATAVPASLVVIGGGAIGVELAQMFERFGSKVTVVEVGPRLVDLEEPESSALVQTIFEREGIDVICDAKITSVSRDGNGFTVGLVGSEPVRGEKLLVATGRRPDLSAIATSTVGIDEKQRSIPIDGHTRAAEKLWAIGDVTGHGQFTHMSMYLAEICIADVLGQDFPPAEYHAVPRVTFTDPEVGSVGLTESQARAQGLKVATGYYDLPKSTRGWIHKVGNDGFIKLVEDTDRGVLVGATSAGPTGGEVLSMLTLAVYAEIPAERLRHMIYAYPTFHRAVEAALDDLKSNGG
jgi:pyruvate/2-oxoglutarate dehydrogenase complex dihydrolipoamide dehydrogenase (E3) component